MDSKRKLMKYSKTAFLVILILLIGSMPFLMMLSSFRMIAFDLNYYHDKYTELDVYENPKFLDVNLMNETAFLLNYLKHGDGVIQTDFYNQREKSHLVDVRNMFRTALSLRRFFFFFSLIMLIFLFRLTTGKEEFVKGLSKYLMYGSLLTIGMLLLGWLFMMNFDASFTGFHKIFFTGDTWLFNPMTDNLINMVPQQFFYDITKDILSLTFILALIGLAVGAIMNYRPLLSRYGKKFITKKD
ncbi:TIGR01906 family membrane protein [Thermoproteota archaeon]